MLVPSLSLTEKFILEQEFFEKKEIDANEIDCFSQEKIKDLIRERQEMHLPFFLIVGLEEDGGIFISEGIAFLRNYYKYGHQDNPLNRKKITIFHIYKKCRQQNELFHLLCKDTALRLNLDFYPKYINACDPDLQPSLRGTQRFAIATLFEEMTKNKDVTNQENIKLLKKAQKWYIKGKEDKDVNSFLALAEWYLLGNPIVGQAVSTAVQLLEEALNILQQSNETNLSMISIINETIQTAKDRENRIFCSASQINL